MASSHNGRRDLRRATQAVAALAVVGTVGGSMLAFGDTTKAAASTSTVTPSPGSADSGAPGTSSVLPPQTGAGSAGSGSSTPGTTSAGSLGSGTLTSPSDGGFTAPPTLSSGSGSPVVTSSGS